jgi:predicted secreted Zn-dependent protease
MTFKTLVSATLLFAFAAPLPADAATTTTYVFETVDSYDISGQSREVQVTGIISGEAEPRTVTLTYYPYNYYANTQDELSIKRTFERCERFALMAMSKPGQYLLEMRQEFYNSSFPAIGCKLTRR